jgi:hypothetical protein
MQAKRLWLGLTFFAYIGCDPYVYMEELPSQPTDATHGKWIAVEAESGTSPVLRVRVRAGKMALPDEAAATHDLLCLDLDDGDLDTVLNVIPNGEAVVVAELVGRESSKGSSSTSDDCTTSEGTGPVYVLVVRGSEAQTTSSITSSTGDSTSETASSASTDESVSSSAESSSATGAGGDGGGM